MSMAKLINGTDTANVDVSNTSNRTDEISSFAVEMEKLALPDVGINLASPWYQIVVGRDTLAVYMIICMFSLLICLYIIGYSMLAPVVGRMSRATARLPRTTVRVSCDSVELCERCQHLGLTSKAFLVPPTEQLRDVAKTRSPIHCLKSGSNPIVLGKAIQLSKLDSTCRFCNLVKKCLQKYGNGKLNQTGDCVLEWEIDGHEEKADMLYNITRRIRLHWDQDEECEEVDETQDNAAPRSFIHTQRVEVHLLYVPENRNRTAADNDSVWKKENRFLARDYDKDGGNQARIRSWIDVCAEKHQEHGLSPTDDVAFQDLIETTSFGVVDVVALQLVRLPKGKKSGKPARYVALSYVWGKPAEGGEDYRTLKSNVMARCKPGGLESVWKYIPLTIQNSIQLVRNLGERYIWIDSLCIVQDSPTSWKLNASHMYLVYSNAFFTICAADGHDSRKGLVAFDPKDMETPLKDEQLHLLVSRPLETVLQASRWNQRAWTFQERMLSPRTLIFAGNRVYFQCRSMNMSMDVIPDGTGKGWSPEWKNSPLRTLGELTTQPIGFYTKCVAFYSGRHLTLPKDILAAFDGVSHMISKHLQAPLIYGLPTSHFDLALLWEPLSGQTRRTRRPETEHGARCSQDKVGKCTCNQEEKTFGTSEFPSWSWCGWQGAQNPQKGAPVVYNQYSLEGCLTSIHEWLVHHTWIDWFIRDKNGDLRSIWENHYMESDVREGMNLSRNINRWTGYLTPTEVEEQLKQTVAEETHTTANVQDMEPLEDICDDYRPRTPSLPESPTTHHHLRPVNIYKYYAPRYHHRNRHYHNHYYHNRRARERSTSSETDNAGTEIVPYIVPPPSDENVNTPKIDHYGRPTRPEIQGRQQTKFHRVLPENPFGVRYFVEGSIDVTLDQPVLQFYTWRAEFYILRDDRAPVPGDGLVRCHVADSAGDWCGTVVVNERWLSHHTYEGRLFNFIALSDAKSFIGDECTVWTHYIPKDYKDVEWDLFYVMLIEFNKEKLVWERVGIGKTFRTAFNLDDWDEIKLG